MVIAKGGGKFRGTYTKCSVVRFAGKVFAYEKPSRTLL